MELRIRIEDLSDGTTREVVKDADTGISIGRGSGSDISLAGADLSRPHCRLLTNGGQLFVEDQSRNGTLLNGTRVPAGQRLAFGPTDIITVPGYELRVLMSEEADTGQTVEAKSPLAPVAAFWSSFTALEKFAAGAALAAIGVLATYMTL